MTGVFLSHKVNARRTVHCPRYHLIITVSLATNVTEATLRALGRNPDRSWWHHYTINLIGYPWYKTSAPSCGRGYPVDNCPNPITLSLLSSGILRVSQLATLQFWPAEGQGLIGYHSISHTYIFTTSMPTLNGQFKSCRTTRGGGFPPV